MPLPGPLPSEQAVFAKHLFIQGYPLWNPDPVLLPQGLQRVGFRIGDVGTVDERGRFDVFFNILDPTPGSSGSQSIFPPIEENDVRCSSEDILPREVISSPQTSWDAEQLEVETVTGVTRKITQYGATLSNDGAHIILPQGAQLFELGLRHRRLFENHAMEHGADWLKRYRDRLGSPRSNSLYLLTGFYKTCSWSIASFSMKTAANTDPVCVHCTLMEVDERLVLDESVWQPTGRFNRKIGPAPDRQGQNNQAIFIRGIMITPNPSELEQSKRRAGLLGVLSGPTRFLSTLVAGASTATATEAQRSDVIIQHVPQISQASHPSEIINQYLLSKEPSARIAVTHDSQWIAMLKMSKGEKLWTLEDLENDLDALVQERHYITTYNGTVYLREKELSDFSANLSHSLHPPLSDHVKMKRPLPTFTFSSLPSHSDAPVRRMEKRPLLTREPLPHDKKRRPAAQPQKKRKRVVPTTPALSFDPKHSHVPSGQQGPSASLSVYPGPSAAESSAELEACITPEEPDVHESYIPNFNLVNTPQTTEACTVSHTADIPFTPKVESFDHAEPVENPIFDIYPVREEDSFQSHSV